MLIDRFDPQYHSIKHIVSLLLLGLLLSATRVAFAQPVVSGNVISWPADQWYQVMSADGSTSICNGTFDCVLPTGQYLVINHTDGVRFENVFVVDPAASLLSYSRGALEIRGNTISWPQDGWYQVLNEAGYVPVCNGGTDCPVEPGSYFVINHTTGVVHRNVLVVSAKAPDELDTLVDRDRASPGYDPSAINLTTANIRTGRYELVDAYPNLRFQEALFVTAVPAQPRLVVVEQKGKVKVFDDNSDATVARIIIDIGDRLVYSGEQGLLGFAFDPAFASNHYVYLYYTEKDTNRSIVARYTWDSTADQLLADSELRILEVPQPFPTHNAGMLAFGPDGYLYIALGDGGDGGDPYNNAQDLSTLLGSILRIDVSAASNSRPYEIPADNPFVLDAAARDEIYAYGLRNPFRFSFDRTTGVLWAGDVGQGTVEEINQIEIGGNYGWRVYEGSRPNDGNLNTLPDSAFTPPIFEYGHDEGLAVIGGYVYRGSNVPSLQGHYLYSDFYSGSIWALETNEKNVIANQLVSAADGPASFGETQDGDVLVVTRYDGLYRIRETGASGSLPATLADTGLFSDLSSMQPVDGFVNYTPQVQFWSDDAAKDRWFGIPAGSKVEVDETSWQYPLGTIAIKHFEKEMIVGEPASLKRLETRIYMLSEGGWQGFSYRWNEDGSSTYLVTGAESEMLKVTNTQGVTTDERYDYPGQAECSICHRAQSGLLGFNAEQLNYSHESGGGVNQLHELKASGIFNADIGAIAKFDKLSALDDEQASIEARARSYLDVNCGYCHNSAVNSPTNLDLRIDVPLASSNMINAPTQAGGLGLEMPKIITPGQRQKSSLWLRMSSTGSERMPPLSSHVIDQQAVELIGQWIDNMPTID